MLLNPEPKLVVCLMGILMRFDAPDYASRAKWPVTAILTEIQVCLFDDRVEYATTLADIACWRSLWLEFDVIESDVNIAAGDLARFQDRKHLFR